MEKLSKEDQEKILLQLGIDVRKITERLDGMKELIQNLTDGLER